MPPDTFALANILFLMMSALFLLGVISFFAGVLILLKQTLGRDVHSLALQSSRLAQKGVLDGVADIVSAASTLMDSTNQLVRTTTGIGVFLIGIGLVLMIFPAVIIWKLSTI